MDLELTSQRLAFEVDAMGVMDYAVENGVRHGRPPITSGELCDCEEYGNLMEISRLLAAHRLSFFATSVVTH
jgi:hypothetical protein